MLRIQLLCLVLALTIAAPTVAAPKAPGDRVDFGADVRPIFSDHCYACHGPDEKARQGNLRLDTKEGAFADRDGRPVLVPGDPAKSLVYQRMSHPQEVARMPPPSAERQPSAEQVEVVRLWIEQGAKWETHWAYERPERPELPAVSRADWVRNEIDRFVLARLDAEGLQPSEEADKRTLLRRLSLDLTGLPPTPEEVDQFLEDRSPNAYERQVERLLASPRYGERMAIQWLDLARYADTHGYHIDSLRQMWPWRDWVIRAFNENKPFDEFTVEQLAGDLLPSPTGDQLIATGFNRNHMINFEGGAIPAEYHTEYVVDRVETTATTWMAMTMGCARCHDHKYDPIKQREFYQFFGFFNSIDEKGLDGVLGNAAPVMEMPDAARRQRLDQLNERIEDIESKLPDGPVDAAVETWEASALRTMPSPERRALLAHYEMEGGFADSSGAYRHGRILRGEPNFSNGRAGRAASFDVDTHVELTGTDEIDLSRPFSLAFWFRPSGFVEKGLLYKMEDPDTRRGLELLLTKPRSIPDELRREYDLLVRLSKRWPDDAIEVKTKIPLDDSRRKDSTYHVVISYDGSGKASGFSYTVNGEPREVEALRDGLRGSPNVNQPFEIGAKRFARRYTGMLDDLRIYGRVLPQGDVDVLYVHEPIRALLGEPAMDCEAILAEAPKEAPEDDVYAPKKDSAVSRCENRMQRLRSYYLEHAAPQNDRRLYSELESLRRERAQIKEEVPTLMVMREMSAPRDTFMLGRGDYRNRTEQVEPSTPDWLPPFPSDAPRNRLGLARWLTSSEHPLTARVAVNRYWQRYFSLGLVRTSEDFGSQGESPTHRDLLDWLATEFIRSDWDVKAIQRLIVTSATYRQSSRTSPELLQRDSENRLLARGARFRLPAELVRDNALAVAGLLEDRIGGPSVFPYQPPGIWEEMAYGDMFTAQVYRPSTGRDLYRRSLYTFWKRTVPPPSLAAFDAPDREKCSARRANTNTPLQALVLMNDPTYVEAARVLAQRMMAAYEDAGGRVRLAYLRALAREPGVQEEHLLIELAEKQLEKFNVQRKEALALVSIGETERPADLDVAELAAWTTVASAVLNLDETITRE